MRIGPFIIGYLPFHDFGYSNVLERFGVNRSMRRVLKASSLHSYQRYVSTFENEFASFVGSPHAIGLASGTDALYFALSQAGVGPGREVITSANTWVTTLTTVDELGGSCHFVDVDRDTGLMDTSLVERAVGSNTAAIVPIHMYGYMVPMQELMDLASAREVVVIEDACQGVGATYKGRSAGTWGDAGCFSFHITKLVGAPGDGGMLVTSHKSWETNIRTSAVAQWDQALLERQCRVPSRLSPLQVPVLSSKLKLLNKRIANRKRQWHRYEHGLRGADGVRVLRPAEGVAAAHRNCIIVTENKSLIIQECRRAGISVEEIYPNSADFVERLSRKGWQLPNTLEIAQKNVSLPLGRQMSARSIDKVISIVRKYSE